MARKVVSSGRTQGRAHEWCVRRGSCVAEVVRSARDGWEGRLGKCHVEGWAARDGCAPVPPLAGERGAPARIPRKNWKLVVKKREEEKKGLRKVIASNKRFRCNLAPGAEMGPKKAWLRSWMLTKKGWENERGKDDVRQTAPRCQGVNCEGELVVSVAHSIALKRFLSGWLLSEKSNN
ncbi:hypothetical protein GOBAR_AA01648 [Gossypium barbadense]|uniref:Uncharacterized protein n=1 Tax=Gossypium barbadense TaxID=3634 RepID=A0A2P5YTS4_GOSBA|nr:hypothetical protein GOBAR_AA01648 [Gossypium barbadense]